MTFQRFRQPATPLATRAWAALGALHGAMALMAGAFGAHGVTDPRVVDLLHTGARWEAVAALAAILAARAGATTSAALQVAGAALFAGALYALALGGPSILGALAPIGGTLMILAWLFLARNLWRGDAST